MTTQIKELIKKAYTAFNERDINKALSAMQPDVQWSKAWEGGCISGHEEIRAYWTRQWSEIDPNVEPVSLHERENDRIEVKVHQVVRDLQGKSIYDGIVRHVYTFKENLIQTMDIEQ